MANQYEPDVLTVLQGQHQEFKPDAELASKRNRVTSENAASANISTGSNQDNVWLENVRSVVVRAGDDNDSILIRNSTTGASGSLNGGDGNDNFDIYLAPLSPASRLSVNGDAGEEDIVLMDGQDFTIRRNADGTATIKGQNGSVINLTGIEYIKYEGDRGLRIAALGDLPVGITMNFKTAINANPADTWGKDLF